MDKKINLGINSKTHIVWNVRPEDYTKDKADEIIVAFAKKYNVDKNNVKVEPNFIKIDNNGKEITLTNDVTDNIQDPKFQQELFKQFIEEYKIENYDLDEILSIDNQINSMIDYELYDKYRKYNIKWIKWSNFLSFGEDNILEFDKLKGLILLNGTPANQSGKSSISINLLKFLCFGTTDKTDVLAEIFNHHLKEAINVVVEGCIEIDGEEYIIKRILSRPELKKRTDKSKVIQKVEYYKIVNGIVTNLEECGVERKEEESTTQTNKVIKEAIGNEKDFNLIISANSKTLNDLIDMGATERGKTFTKWIGLSVLNDKDKLAKDRFNKEVVPNLYSTKYNREVLKQEIEDLGTLIVTHTTQTEELVKKISDSDTTLKGLDERKEDLLKSRGVIDETVSKIDITTLNTSIEQDTITKKDKVILLAEKKKELDTKYSNIKFTKENEILVTNLTNEITQLDVEMGTLRSSIESDKKEIIHLTESSVCPTCKRKLDNVDFSANILELKQKIEKSITEGVDKKKKKENKTVSLNGLSERKKLSEEKNKLELFISKIEVDKDVISNRLDSNIVLYKKYEENKDTITKNNKIDLNIINLNTTITKEREFRDGLLKNKEQLTTTIKNNGEQVVKKKQILSEIEKEDNFIRNWKIYLGLVGKNGIAKLVLRKTLPIINGELSRLLNEVCDFDVSVEMDDNGDVGFFILRDGVKSKLASGSGFEQTTASLALRTVLANISTMPRPNFLVLDEVLGGVAEENYDKVKDLYDKILQNYSFILHITHLNQIIDWHDMVITVKKEKNISKIVNKI